MLLTAECVLVRDENSWVAEFPQFNFTSTSGRTREEAIANAREALELEAFDILGEGGRAPRARHVAEVHVLTVDVTEEDAERSRYVTKAQAAERLGVSRPRVTALVASGRLSVKAFGGQELVSLESIAGYASSPREAGRPALAPA